MTRVYVRGIGVFGPGCIGWPATRSVLAREHRDPGALEPPAEPGAPPPADLLPAIERRRATPSTRLALAVAQEALAAARVDPSDVPAVFASSSGSPSIIHDLCAMLAANDFQISPTKFHNSVHNAASGYYSIATSCRRGATTICAYDATAAVALLEASAQVLFEPGPVLLVSYDIPYPPPLSWARPMADSWGVALLLTARASPNALAQLQLAPGAAAETQMTEPALEAARASNPTARFLPLLWALARIGSETGVGVAPISESLRVALPNASGGTLLVDVARC